jgi:hypothetical protein
MKTLIILFSFVLGVATVNAQTKAVSTTITKQKVEASCGKCKFGMEGDDCELAVRINGKAYLVDGTSIDQHGDAHAKDGFCNAVRKAEVSGEIVGDKFKATHFKLLADKKNKKSSKTKSSR